MKIQKTKFYGVLVMVCLTVLALSACSLSTKDSNSSDKQSPTSGTHKKDEDGYKSPEEPTVHDNEFLNSLSPVVAAEAITHDNKEYALYPVFEDMELALSKFVEKYPNNIKTLEQQYELGPFSVQTSLDYARASATHFMSNDSEDWAKTVEFLDVYADAARNQKIIDFTNSTAKQTMSEQEYEDELAAMMPYTSELYIEYNNRKNE